MGEAAGAGVFDQAVHLRHAGPGGDQHQGAIRQLGQMGIPIGQLDLGHALAFQLRQQRLAAGLARQHVQFQLTPLVGRRGQGKGRLLAVVTTDQQVLAGVIARRSPGRRAQPYPADIAPHVIQRHHLAGQRAHRQFAGRQDAVPLQQAIAQGHRHADIDLAVIDRLAVLADLPFHQQRGAELAVAVAAAVRSAVAEALRGGQDGFAGLGFQYRTRGLQGDLHRRLR